MPVDQDRFLTRIVTDAPKDRWGKRQLLPIHGMLTEVDKFGIYSKLLQLCIKPFCHDKDVFAIGRIA